MIVLKFGGTSVQSAEWMNNVIDIVEQRIDRAPVLVSSAMSKVTDVIITAYESAENGNEAGVKESISFLREKHLDAAKEFLTGDNLNNALSKIEEYLVGFSSLLRGIYLLKECSLRSKDTLLSYGERLSTLLLYYRTVERGLKSELLDSRDFIITNDSFTSAVPIMDLTETKIREYVNPTSGKIVITQGFISATREGITTTLGRGGSDYTAAIIGAALSAEEIQIWTDVNGIMTTDPRIVKEARPIKSMTYNEAGELAYFGAKVVHPSTIQPAVRESIPVCVKNTHQPDHPGTTIVKSTESHGVKAISIKKNITVINIASSRMLNSYGFLGELFEVFNCNKTSVDLVSTSEVSVSITIDNIDALDSIVKELEEFSVVTVEKEKTIVCLVGQGLWRDSVFLSRVFGALSSIPVRMISLGSSDTNLSLVVPFEKAGEALIDLHKEFFG